MKSFHLWLCFAMLLLVSTAHGLMIGFEAPIYSSGVSVIGRDGWVAGTNLGGSQAASSSFAYSGGQSMVFDNTSMRDVYSVAESTTFAPGTAYAISTKIYVSSATSANRIYGLYLANGSSMSLFNTVLGMTIGGDGSIRAGTNYDATDGASLAKAAAGTFADRWLSLDISFDGRGRGTTKISGFSNGASYAYDFGSVTTPTNVQAGSDFIGIDPSAYAGMAAFDNFSFGPQAVPEPAPFAALGLSALVLLRRRRRSA